MKLSQITSYYLHPFIQGDYKSYFFARIEWEDEHKETFNNTIRRFISQWMPFFFPTVLKHLALWAIYFNSVHGYASQCQRKLLTISIDNPFTKCH